MRPDGSDTPECGGRGDADGEALRITRLRVKLHLENSETSVGGVELSRNFDRELALLSSIRGDDAEEQVLEVVDDFDGSFLRPHSLRFVVAYHVLWRRKLNLPLLVVTVAGAGVVNGGILVFRGLRRERGRCVQRLLHFWVGFWFLSSLSSKTLM